MKRNSIISYIKTHWLLIVIVLLAIYLRIYRIDSIPPSPSLDEVSLGWNAYSLLKTGKDEYGNVFPWVLRAYDDFRPALYVYLVIPAVALFGLTTTAVRFPSVLLSISAVIATYFLARMLLKQLVTDIQVGGATINPGHISAFLLAISPWHIYISRLGHEVNAGLSFLIIGCVCFFGYLLEKKQRIAKLMLAAVFWSASFGSYQSEKIVIPLLVGCIGLFCLKRISEKKHIVIAGLIGIIIALPTALVTFRIDGLTRFSGTSAFTESNPLYEQERLTFIAANSRGDQIGSVIHHPRLTSAKIFLSNYSKHFKWEWLFEGGPLGQHKVPYTGLLYGWTALFILCGIVMLLRKRTYQGWIIFCWIAIAPIPGSITTQAPHAMRSFTFLPGWELLATVGFLWICSRLRGVTASVLIGVVSILAMVSTLTMFQRYTTVFPVTQSQWFGFALFNALQYVEAQYGPDVKITVTDVLRASRYGFASEHRVPESDYQTYMYYLFASTYDPKTYQSFGGTKSGGLGQQFSFGNVMIEDFRGKPLAADRVYIGKIEDFPAGTPFTYEAKYLDGVSGVYVR